MKKEKLVTSKDEKDWNNFINNTDSVYDKDSEESINYIKKNRTKKIDLHGLSISKANEEVKFFLIIQIIPRGFVWFLYLLMEKEQWLLIYLLTTNLVLSA